MCKKQGILVVSFGTSHRETREKTIAAIEQQMQEAFPAYEVRRAFTSGMIMEILKKRDAIHVDNVTEALEKMARDGFTHVLLQPTHILNGDEYEKMEEQAKQCSHQFHQLTIGKPLLTDSSDYEAVCRILIEKLPKENEEEVIVLMGHGTGHFADAAYAALDYRFKALGREDIFVGTVEGYPELEDVIPQLHRFGAKKVTLLPFMVVAGDHAVNDMAGDGEDSWKSVLQREGMEVRCLLKGLGEFPEIRDLYIRHGEEAMER